MSAGDRMAVATYVIAGLGQDIVNEKWTNDERVRVENVMNELEI
jgi:hypothetical protein